MKMKRKNTAKRERGEWRLQYELNAYFPPNKINISSERTFMPLIYFVFFSLAFEIQSHSKLTEREQGNI